MRRQWQALPSCAPKSEDGDFSHEMKRRFLLGSKAMTNQDSILKSGDNTLPTKVRPVKYRFSSSYVQMKSLTVRKAEGRNTVAFGLWSQRRLFRVPWTARRSNLSILQEISPGCSLEELMLSLKLQYFVPRAANNWLTGIDSDGGKDSRWEKKGDDGKWED